jgi:hypothetical protein
MATINTAKKCEIANKILKALNQTNITPGNIKIEVEMTKTKAEIKSVKIEQ